MQFTSIYLSRLLGNKIYSSRREAFGTLTDLAVDINFKNPKVTSAVVKTKDGIKYIDFDNINISHIKEQYVLNCSNIQGKDLGSSMLLKKYVLDKQIIDVNGRKVVRANDVRLVLLSSGMYIAAVDIGMEGLLRRIGIAKPLKSLGFKVSGSLILWHDVQTAFTSKDILLSKTYNKLHTLHPSDLADIIEDFDANTGALIFSSLDNAKAADVLEELEDDVQENLIRTLPADKAADILEEMPADEAANVLDGLSENKAEELLNNMEKEASDEIRELLDYDESLIGSIMNTDFISYPPEYTVSDVINNIRSLKEEIGQNYYVYVVDAEDKLIGVVSLMDIIISYPENKLKDIMNKEVFYMHDKEEISDLVKSILKYNLSAMPVTDEEMHLIGTANLNDVVYEFTKHIKKFR